MGGGAGTGRDSVVLTPYPGNSSNLQNSPAPSGGANSPITSASTDTGLGFLTATDRVMATMQVFFACCTSVALSTFALYSLR